VTQPKLVRDKIPAIICGQGHGQDPLIYTASDGEYRERLRDKLLEEVNEFLTSGDLDELADILEVVYALAAQQGIPPGQLEEFRAQKAEERGGFTARIIWCGNAPAQDTGTAQGSTVPG